MFLCYACGHKTAVWCADFDSEDYGYEWEGIVSVYECYRCGARITVEMPTGPIEDEE